MRTMRYFSFIKPLKLQVELDDLKEDFELSREEWSIKECGYKLSLTEAESVVNASLSVPSQINTENAESLVKIAGSY